MRLVIDGRDDLLPVETGDTLGSVYTRLRTHLEEQGRVIRAAHVDSHLITPEIEADNLDTPVSELNEMVVSTCTPAELAVTVLAGIEAAFDRFEPELVDIAATMQKGDAEQGVTRFAAMLGELIAVLETIVNTSKLLDLPLNEMSVAGASVSERAEVYGQTLRSAHEAVELGDSVTLTDVIEYEIPEMLVEWREIIRAFIEQGRARGIEIRTENTE